MTWDAHAALHQTGVESDACSECAINTKHAERWAEALALGPVTDAQATIIAEANRQDWIAWRPTDDTPKTRHDKAQKIEAFVVAHHGEEVTLQQIMEETDAAQGTAYAYIRDMALSFRRVGTSRYRVTDTVRTRAETLAGAPATIAQDVSGAANGTDAAAVSQTANPTPIREPSKP